MAKNIQIRNVPEDLHRTLKARAARMGMSLSDYLLSEVEHIAERPTVRELMERLATRDPVRVNESSAEIIRRHRDA
jgi:plasmid stability protein